MYASTISRFKADVGVCGWRWPLYGFFIFLLLTWLPACAVNPVSGQADFVLMSEDDEIKLGRQAHPQILKQYGGYNIKALQTYVQKVGERLAANSHRANLVYRFTVVDSPEVNAFALPGGYIYITRGLLAYLNSEAELAAVLGHEIGHVTARHSVRQISTARAAGIGYTIGSIFLPELRSPAAQDLFNVLGSALISGYGREHELEADRLGAEYLARSDYDPQAMIKVISVLKDQELFEKQLAQEEGREPRIYHGIFASHPDNDTRLQEVVAAADTHKSIAVISNRRDVFLNQLTGLTFGDSESQGILRANQFFHKDLDIAITFPSQWRIDNRPDRLIASPVNQEGFLQITTQDLNKRISPREFMLTRLDLDELVDDKELNVSGLKGHTGIAQVRVREYGTRRARLAVVYLRGQAFIFVGVAQDKQSPQPYDEEFLHTVHSFHVLKQEERKFAEAQRIVLIEASGTTRFKQLAAESSITNHAEEQLRLLNQYYPSGEPAVGELVKIVR